MPTYEYACKSCGEHHDVVQKFGDDPLTECPSCGGPVRKVFGAVGVVFKGSGFYKTDSRTSAKNGGKPDTDGKADKGEKPEKPEKPDKSDKSGKSDKIPAASGAGGSDSSNSSGSKSSESSGSGSGSSSKSGEKTSTGAAAAAS